MVVKFFFNSDEINWLIKKIYYNIIGNEWDTVIGNVTLSITMPKEFDSSNINYEEINKPSEYIKKTEWDMAIGLQEVDNLKPSKYLEKLLQEKYSPLEIIAKIGNIIPLNTPKSFLSFLIILIKIGKYIAYIVIIGNSDESNLNSLNQLSVRFAP